MSGDLYRVAVKGGHLTAVPNTYDGIKEGLDGGTLDFLRGLGESGIFLDDNGLSKELELNVVASIMMARPIYGPVVVCNAEVDAEGETLPPTPGEVKAWQALSAMWGAVVLGAESINQQIMVRANPDTVPPPQVVSLTEEQFDAYLATGEVPEP